MLIFRVYRQFILVILFLSITISTSFADINFDNSVGAVIQISIFGKISPNDSKELAQAISDLKRNYNKKIVLLVRLDTNGGNVEASLDIGKMLRKEEATAVVGDDAVCLSSCVLILAGAPYRTIAGRVGIHRPYMPNDTNTSVKLQKQKYSNLGKVVRKYLVDMNVQPKLYDDMVYISPENVKILSAENLTSYGLNGNDPYFDEANASKEAQKAGLSRIEYSRRQSRAISECNEMNGGNVNDFGRCYQDIMQGRR